MATAEDARDTARRIVEQVLAEREAQVLAEREAQVLAEREAQVLAEREAQVPAEREEPVLARVGGVRAAGTPLAARGSDERPDDPAWQTARRIVDEVLAAQAERRGPEAAAPMVATGPAEVAEVLVDLADDHPLVTARRIVEEVLAEESRRRSAVIVGDVAVAEASDEASTALREPPEPSSDEPPLSDPGPLAERLFETAPGELLFEERDPLGPDDAAEGASPSPFARGTVPTPIPDPGPVPDPGPMPDPSPLPPDPLPPDPLPPDPLPPDPLPPDPLPPDPLPPDPLPPDPLPPEPEPAPMSSSAHTEARADDEPASDELSGGLPPTVVGVEPRLAPSPERQVATDTARRIVQEVVAAHEAAQREREQEERDRLQQEREHDREAEDREAEREAQDREAQEREVKDRQAEREAQDREAQDREAQDREVAHEEPHRPRETAGLDPALDDLPPPEMPAPYDGPPPVPAAALSSSATVVEPPPSRDREADTTVAMSRGVSEPPRPRTGRWLLTTILGAVALALLFPLAVRALRSLVTLSTLGPW